MAPSSFQNIFGVPPESVGKLCVLIPYPLPVLSGALAAGNPAKGKIYTTSRGPQATLIQAPMGAAFCGDALLWLKDTPCQRVIFVGSCGSLRTPEELPLGSIVMPKECYALESFSVLLKGVEWTDAHTPDENLLAALPSIRAVRGATLGSLAREQNILPQLKDKGIEVVDMECSAVYSGARAAGLPALSLLFVTDYLEGKAFFEPQTAQEKGILASSLKQIAENILKIDS